MNANQNDEKRICDNKANKKKSSGKHNNAKENYYDKAHVNKNQRKTVTNTIINNKSNTVSSNGRNNSQTVNSSNNNITICTNRIDAVATLTTESTLGNVLVA